ncbi:PREDICTED: tripartite motif-containing protein 10-like, partial [Merops nubicus]|uniref:tripartite motif-containing protein 10-like n=1 Tax=Merops nubicus TaxID=57421 RepID=UPI0004F0B8DA
WAMGVAVESVPRRSSLARAMRKIWALQLDWNHQYWALHVRPALLALEEDPRVIDIHLDYEAGKVTFCDVGRKVQILQLKAFFTERVFPYFWLQSEKTSIQMLG